MKNILTEYGYTVIVAEDGEEAIKKFSDHKDEIQLCLLDIIMPKKSGMEVYKIVQKNRPGIKVIFSSGYTGDKVQRDELPPGSEFIEKPSSPQVFLNKIRETIKGYNYADRLEGRLKSESSLYFVILRRSRRILPLIS